MIAVKNPNELACCKCKFQETSLGDNGWTCSLTHERGYPCYADAYDRLDNCPFNPSPIEHRYAYGTKEPIPEKEEFIMELRRKWFSTASELTIFVNERHIKRENIQGILTDSNSYTLFYWKKVLTN